MNSTKTLYSIFASLILLMIGVFAFAVNTNSYESTETDKIEEAQVIMYGTPQCHYCAKARKLFSEQGVVFYEYDISKNREAYKTFQQLQGRGTPLIIIGKEVVKGFNKSRIQQLLDTYVLVEEIEESA